MHQLILTCNSIQIKTTANGIMNINSNTNGISNRCHQSWIVSNKFFSTFLFSMYKHIFPCTPNILIIFSPIAWRYILMKFMKIRPSLFLSPWHSITAVTALKVCRGHIPSKRPPPILLYFWSDRLHGFFLYHYILLVYAVYITLLLSS